MVYLGFLVAFLGLLHPTGASLRISTSSSQRAFAGSNVLLHCTFSGDGLTAGSRFLAIMWYYHGTEIVRYFEKVDISHPRVSFNEEEARRGNASILLSDVELQDEGIYSCLVIYGQEKKEQQIILNVLVPPKIQIFSKAVSEENTLVCSVTGFYPEEIAVTWLRDGELLRNSSLGKKQRNADGTYSVNSTVIIPIPPDRDPRNEAVSCRVRHESLSEPLQEDFQLVYGGQTEETSTVTVIVCVCGAAVLAAGFGWLLWRLKPWKKGGFTLSEIAGPDKLIDGEVVTLCCTGNLCAENTRVIWLEKKAGGEAETIPNPGGDLEEAERLLNTSYVIETKDEGSQRYSSNLRFTFHVANHKGVTFICRFIGGNKTLEKRFHCTNIYAKPKLVNPVKPSLCVSGEILCSLRLIDFYPRDIRIRWSCGTRERQEIISSEENPDLTFSVCSEVRISEKFFKDPECKVCVTWRHGSMDGEETKEMSVLDPDFPWTPVVGEIQTPRLFLHVPVELECKISGYFPDALTVNWLSDKGGYEEETLVTDTDSISIKSRRDADLTYSCSAILTVTPSLETHQGARIICRVQHPTMEKPIEKRTEELRVTVKPRLVKPVTMTLMGNTRVQFSLHMERFHPKDIEIVWQKEMYLSTYLLLSTETLTETNDHTFNVTSWCSAPGAIFAKPDNKVCVTWKHESLDVPEERSWSVRDLPWRPVMEEITIPKLEAAKPVTLSCEISGYFPDSLSVEWIKMENGNKSEIKLPTRDYNIPDIKAHKKEDNTLTCQARLTFTPNLERDQGAEFICRVTHPTLEEPREKRTGPLLIEKD